jgi:UPF0716 protein FxsA
MLFYLLLLFTVVPLVELSLLFWLGGQTVWWLPVLLVLATGIAAAILWRWQGWRTFMRIRNDMSAGRMPTDALIDGLLIFLAGALLITPGLLTDFAGIALLIRPTRAVVKRYAQAWFLRHVEVKTAAFRAAYAPESSHPPDGDQIIDAHVISSHVEDVKQ